MEIKRISDSGNTLSFEFTCPFCSKKYTVEQVWKRRKNGSSCRYNFKEDEGICEHLLLWDTLEVGGEYQPELYNLEWVTRMSHLPFRVWDVLQEVIKMMNSPKIVRFELGHTMLVLISYLYLALVLLKLWLT